MTVLSTESFKDEREQLVELELRTLGIRDESVLQAMKEVPREEFVAEEMREFAYRNAPLPIESGQTISQPLIVALMAEALELGPNDRVLEIGAGSGYAAAVLSRIAREVFTVERIAELAKKSRTRLKRLGYDNVYLLHSDGTRGWSDHAPYDAIVVAAAGPVIPKPLLDQLAVGGRLVIPIGQGKDSQQLIRIVKRQEGFEHEELGGVRFVPLIGEAGWHEDENVKPTKAKISKPKPEIIPEMIRKAAEPVSSYDEPNIDRLLERISDARLVLIGEATHGTSEFYRIRTAITKALLRKNDFDFIAIEADWPDAYRIHDFVTHKERDEPRDWEAFSRFPTWMWRNEEVHDFIHWLRDFNLNSRSEKNRVGFFGLDLYSLFTSIHAVLEYLDSVDPETAEVARFRYGCLTPWELDPASYGRAALSGRYRNCEEDVVQMLKDILGRRVETATHDGEELFNAQLNAQLVASAEKYYRIMYYGSDASWNHRDRHMFQTLKLLLQRYGNGSKGIVWEHNSHLGNAAATQFGKHGQINVGQLCREEFGDKVYSIGQCTDHGTVAAASEWEGSLEIKKVLSSHPDSYERLMHQSGIETFLLPLAKSSDRQLVSALAARRLERAIGVIYRPETERLSHYFDVSLPHQFDEIVWVDESSAVRALTTEQRKDYKAPHPFAIIDE
ncbi:MAG: protein-L-isoaspartate(D-aspartate) O-methyltransferase [Bdellovibrionota bacterium]